MVRNIENMRDIVEAANDTRDRISASKDTVLSIKSLANELRSYSIST
jgi:hypothetical protein